MQIFDLIYDKDAYIEGLIIQKTKEEDKTYEK